jgi:pyruvate dehydrogenase E2 component (dihydrolipoamide acetyltransferase)
VTTSISLPALGESVTEGTISQWLVEVGAKVSVDDPLVEISTDKVDTEVPSTVAGVVLELLVAEDDVIPVGTPLCVIDSSAVSTTEESPTAPVTTSAEPNRPEPKDVKASEVVESQPATSASDAAPEARGTSDAERVATSATAPPATPSGDKTEKLTRLRKVIATRMVESLQTSAQLTTVVEVDVTNIAELRARAKTSFLAREGVKLSFLPFFAKAAVEALKIYPQVNSSVDLERGTVTYHGGSHLGIAVDTDKGLFVPVIADAGQLSISGLARAISDAAERTRTGTINADELAGGTFTLTNTGSRGALFDTPIINQPQVAILGTGSVVRRSMVVADDRGHEGIAIRSMVYFALTYDHRIVDGADAARFLTTVKARLESGEMGEGL